MTEPRPTPPQPGSYIDGNRGRKRVVEVVPGIKASLPTFFVANDHHGFDVELEIDLDESGLLRPKSIKVTGRLGGPPIDGTSLRKITVGELVTDAVSNVLHFDQDEKGLRLNPVAGLAHSMTAEDLKRLDEEGGKLNDRGLQSVATLYRAAAVSGLPPQRYIMEAFDLPRSTAGYWISQARKRGFLEPSARGQKKPCAEGHK
jgi:hypothetical protein